MRKVAVPQWSAMRADSNLPDLTQRCLDGEPNAEFLLDAYVAKRIYFLSLQEYAKVLDMFPKLPIEDSLQMKKAFQKVKSGPQDERMNSLRTARAAVSPIAQGELAID